MTTDEWELDEWMTNTFDPMTKLIKEVDQLDWLDKYGAETNQSWIKRANSCLEKDWNDLDAFAPEGKAYEEAFKLLFIDNCLLDSRKEAPHRAASIATTSEACFLVPTNKNLLPLHFVKDILLMMKIF